jgi:hypothetical protein
MSLPGRLARWALVLSCTACSPDEPPAPGQPPAEAAPRPPEPLRTDAPSYQLVRDGVGWRTEITAEFLNTYPDTLHAINCNGALTVAVEKREEAGWTTFWAPMTNACLSPPVTVPPGEAITLPLTIWGAPPGSDAGPQFADTTFAGSYRLLWWNLVSGYDATRGDMGDTIPLRYRVSNEFSLAAGTGR